MIRHVAWFSVLACAVAYAIFLFSGSAMHAGAERVAAPILVRDVLEPGVHHLSGMIQVDSTCKEVVLHTNKVDTFTYALSFSTWEEPSIPCPRETVIRVFNATVFAPAVGVDFLATLDEIPLNIAVFPVISHK